MKLIVYIEIVLFFIYIPTSRGEDYKAGLLQLLINKGYENISLEQHEEQMIITLEINHYKSRRDGLQSILESIRREFPTQDSITVILLNDGIPMISLPVNYATSAKYALPSHWRVHWKKIVSRNSGKIDLILFPQFALRNQKYHRIYDVVCNIAPALELSLWRGATATAQLIIPLFNQFGPLYDQVRPGIVTLQQQLRCENIFIKTTIGWFTQQRWGFDLQLFRPFRCNALRNVALSARVGITGSSYFDQMIWHHGVPTLLTGNIGVHYYHAPSNTEIKVKCERFLAEDIGGRIDIIRYFKRVSIGIYAMQNDIGNFDGGFNFAITLPPYRSKRHCYFNLNSANYLDFEYSAAGLFYNGKSYRVSPREIPIENNFHPSYLTK